MANNQVLMRGDAAPLAAGPALRWADSRTVISSGTSWVAFESVAGGCNFRVRGSDDLAALRRLLTAACDAPGSDCSARLSAGATTLHAQYSDDSVWCWLWLDDSRLVLDPEIVADLVAWLGYCAGEAASPLLAGVRVEMLAGQETLTLDGSRCLNLPRGFLHELRRALFDTMTREQEWGGNETQLMLESSDGQTAVKLSSRKFHHFTLALYDEETEVGSLELPRSCLPHLLDLLRIR